MSKVQKSRLGRGLSSLISLSPVPVEREIPHAPAARAQPPDREPTTDPNNFHSASPTEIRLEDVSPNPHQPRKNLDEAKIAELAASMKTTGVIQPIIVRRQGDQYELIAGERRWRAAKLAGLLTVPAIVREVNAAEQAQMALVENIQREDLNPIERAQSYRSLMDQLGLTQAELAARLGEQRSSVANFLRLNDLAEPVRNMIATGEISLGHAKLLAGVEDPTEQQRLANLIRSQELSVRNLERLIASDGSHGSPDARPTAPAASAHIQDLERNIARQLGMRAQLRPAARKGHGRLIIHYASLDQFDTLLGRLGVATD